MKEQRYKDQRPAETFDVYHHRSRTTEPNWAYEFVRMVTAVPALFLYRVRPIEVDNVPVSGPVLIAANHFSNMDHFLVAVWLRRKIRFMAKSQIFGRNRLLTYIFSHGGVFPVRRGHADEEAFKTIRAIFARGGVVMIYCEGGRSRTGELGEPKPGVGRAALESGVPVVPVAIHGSSGIRGWRRLRFPRVTVDYGEPFSLETVENPTREEQMEAAEAIFARVRAMYEKLDAGG